MPDSPRLKNSPEILHKARVRRAPSLDFIETLLALATDDYVDAISGDVSEDLRASFLVIISTPPEALEAADLIRYGVRHPEDPDKGDRIRSLRVARNGMTLREYVERMLHSTALLDGLAAQGADVEGVKAGLRAIALILYCLEGSSADAAAAPRFSDAERRLQIEGALARLRGERSAAT